MCSVFKLDLSKYNIEDVCRTCGKCDVITSVSLVNVFTHDDKFEEKAKLLREFDLWRLCITEDDGLPQKVCKQCFSKFTLVHDFRRQCEGIQKAFKMLLRRRKELEKQSAEKPFESSQESQLTLRVKESLSDSEQPIDSFDEIPFEDADYKNIPLLQFSPTKATDAGHEEKDVLECDETKPNVDDMDPRDLVPKLEFGGDDSSLSSILLSSDDETELGMNRQSKAKAKQFKCEFCKNFTLENQEDLDAHVKEIHSSDTPYTCPQCTKMFANAKQRNCHIMVSHRWKSHECDVCHKMIKGGKPGLKNHKDNMHNKSNHECTICNKKFENISLNRFRYHLRWHDKSKLFSCKSCDKTFVTRYHMEEHERTHTDERSFLCNICGLGLRSSQNLGWHMKTHTGERSYQCTQCNKAFPTPTGLKSHAKTHSDEKKHECLICHKLFKTKGSLKNHIGNVHKVDFKDGTVNSSPRYQCQLCPRNFIFERDLIKHLRTHQYRRHICDVCGLSYMQSSHLKKHMESVHLNHKPYVCSTCGHAFPFEYNLKQHELTHKEKEFKCKVCNKAFTLLPSLLSHQRTHTGEKPFKCHLCDRAYGNRGNLKSHVEKHLLEKKQNQTFTQIVLPVIPLSAEVPPLLGTVPQQLQPQLGPSTQMQLPQTETLPQTPPLQPPLPHQSASVQMSQQTSHLMPHPQSHHPPTQMQMPQTQTLARPPVLQPPLSHQSAPVRMLQQSPHEIHPQSQLPHQQSHQSSHHQTLHQQSYQSSHQSPPYPSHQMQQPLPQPGQSQQSSQLPSPSSTFTMFGMNNANPNQQVFSNQL